MCFFVAPAVAGAAGAASTAASTAAITNTLIATSLLAAAASAGGAYLQYAGQRQEYDYQSQAALYQYEVQQANFRAQQQFANEYSNYQSSVFESTREAALASLDTQYLLAAQQQIQHEEQASAEVRSVSMQSQQAQARARVAAAEAGVGGITLDALLNEFQREEMEYTAAVDREVQWSRAQYSVTANALRAEAIGRINTAIPAPVQQPLAPAAPFLPPAPTFWGAALRMGSAGIGAYDDITRIRASYGGIY